MFPGQTQPDLEGEVCVMKTVLRGGVKGNCVQTGQGRGAATATVARGVSGGLSWASKPITGAALIEAAL